MKIIISFILAMSLLSSCKAEVKNNNTIILTDENTIVLNTEVSGESVAKVTLMAEKLNAELDAGQPIYLVLNTPGGSISDGIELIQNLNSLGRPVHTLTIFAASMGFQTVQGLGKRLILKNGELMSHHARGQFPSSEFGGQEPSQFSNRYNFWISKLKQLDEQTVKRTNGKQTLASYQKAYENELWIEGQEAVNQGYADQVVNAKCDSSLLTKTIKQDFYYFGIKIVVTFSACPLVTGPLDIKLEMKANDGKSYSLEDFKSLGGQFGTVCSITKTVLCPVDSSLTLEKIEQTKQEVLEKINSKLTKIKK
jgi:ATP-dependent Clp protease, protease subunit